MLTKYVRRWAFRLLLFFSQIPDAHRDLHSFPTRRSSDLGTIQTRLDPALGERELPWAQTQRGVHRVGSVPKVARSEEHTSELQSQFQLVCRLLLEKKKEDGSQRKASESPSPLARWQNPTV